AQTFTQNVTNYLETQHIPHILLNLPHLSFIHTSPLPLILPTYKQIKHLPPQILLSPISPPLNPLFHISPFFKIIPIHPSHQTPLQTFPLPSSQIKSISLFLL
ncbi:STAS domain-containing protein, partial [Bacillus altitudinis]|uniref:STAS domain-containing protein n=1 Tax=Bacillus altitudinis TaxID=293387 RepID=UPI001C930FF3